MRITQTVTIPEWEPSVPHRLMIDIPREVPAGTVILTFTPAPADQTFDAEDDCPICAQHRDPVTGELRFNAETIAAFKEGDAMMRGEIPGQHFKSIEELLADLRS